MFSHTLIFAWVLQTIKKSRNTAEVTVSLSYIQTYLKLVRRTKLLFYQNSDKKKKTKQDLQVEF